MEQYRHEAGWSYIQTTARRLVLNRVRDQAAAKRNKGLTVSADDAMLPDLPDKNPSPEEIAALRESLARSLAAVQRLPKIYRDCILWYLAGYSYVEIAQILGIPEATVKSRLHEARQDLEIE
jgi:RNA polymerase sigma-70 factor (ECF subfamily)